MRPTLAQLDSWAPDTATAAGETAQRIAGIIDAALDAVADAVASATEWRGLARTAAAHRVYDEHDHADEVRNVLQQIADEAADASTDLGHARQYVLREARSATADGFLVSDTGDVRPPTPEHASAARTIEYRIQSGLDAVDEFDERYGAALESLIADLASMTRGQREVVLPGSGARDPDDAVAALRALSPARRRETIGAMTPDDVRALIQADPATVGNLDGVPFEVRATANEITIRNALAHELRRTGGADTPKSLMLNDLLRQRDSPTAPGRTGQDGSPDPALAGPVDGMTERTFIAFEDTEHGSVIEMVGAFGPRTRNATVYIPGTGTNLASSRDNQRAAWNLAQRTGGPVFFYLDGDLPQRVGYEPIVDDLGHGRLPDLPSVMQGTAVDTRFAREMAPRLVDFGRELDAEVARHAPGAATTFIGHSYGGSVLGTAEQLGLRADRVIYASSAGTGIYDGGWHNPNPDVQRFSMTAPGDPIQEIQAFPGNPHGGDPDSAPGVTRLDTGYYGDGREVAGPRAHGDYWNDPESTAFRNLVAVITGNAPSGYVHRGPDAVIPHLLADELRERGVPLRPGTSGRGPYLDLPGPLPDLALPRLPGLRLPRLPLPDLPLTLG